MPGLEDPLFARSLVYLCDYSSNGALGLIVNKPGEVDLKTLLGKLDLPLQRTDLQQAPVYMGGPVHTDRGFVLHSAMTPQPDNSTGEASESSEPASIYGSTMRVTPEVEMTTSRDVLESLSEGKGPSCVMVCLGYSAWAPGQLESEITENSWLTVKADARILFETPPEERYASALRLLGLEPWMLSSQAGHA